MPPRPAPMIVTVVAFAGWFTRGSLQRSLGRLVYQRSPGCWSVTGRCYVNRARRARSEALCLAASCRPDLGSHGVGMETHEQQHDLEAERAMLGHVRIDDTDVRAAERAGTKVDVPKRK